MKADTGYKALADKGFFFIGTDGVYTDGFLVGGRATTAPDQTSPSIAEGVYGTNPDTQPGTKEYNEFRTIFSSYFPLGPKDAPPFTANTFDAATLIALAIQRAGSDHRPQRHPQALSRSRPRPDARTRPAQLGDALLAVKKGDDIDYKGASGAVDLEANGNVKSGFIVWEAFRDAEDQERRLPDRRPLHSRRAARAAASEDGTDVDDAGLAASCITRLPRSRAPS